MPRVWRRRHRRDQQPTRYDSRTQPRTDTHISADGRAALDALKVTYMPEALLTPSLTSSRLDPIKTTA